MKKIVLLILICMISFASVAFAAEQVYFYHTDPAGTPLAISDSTGNNMVWKADYKPFGEEQSITASTSNDRRFVGKEKDVETGFSYFGARYEDARIGRFIAPDPVHAVDAKTSRTNDKLLLNPQRLNLYAYGVNNPYKYVDANGNDPITLAIIANLLFGSTANAPEYRYTPTVSSQTASQFVFDTALMETGGRISGELFRIVTKESTPVARSLGAAAARDAKVIQTGGNTLSRNTLKELELTKEQGKRAIEAMKDDLGLRNDFHQSKIWSDGNVTNSQTGKIIGNLHDYVP